MDMMEFQGINSFLVGMAKKLIEDGREREIRGQICYELPYPVICKIDNPRARIVTISERKWNPVLPYVESLWLGMGHNDLAMPAHYLERLSEFSDDGITLRGAYGPRFRYWNGGYSDYNIGQDYSSNYSGGIDQFKFIIDLLQKDPNSRQAIITIGDPAKDCFDSSGEIKETKDRPCTRNIQFIINDGKLDVFVHMRSNDFMWGASGVNIFNYTFLQEIFAGILGVDVGVYYHIANNFHYYERHKEKVKNIASVVDFEDASHRYSMSFNSLQDYDNNIKKLANYELQLRNGDLDVVLDLESDFASDWGNAILSYYQEYKGQAKFYNSVLNKIINEN